MKLQTSTSTSFDPPSTEQDAGPMPMIPKLKWRWSGYDTALAVIAVVVLLLGLLSGLLSFFLLQRNETTKAKYSLDELAATEGGRLQASISNNLKVTYSVSALFSLNPSATYQDFVNFVNTSQVDFTGVFGLQYAPRVKEEDRATFTSFVRTFGGIYSNYSIWANGPSNTIIRPSPYKANHYPITYALPLAPNVGIIGSDMINDYRSRNTWNSTYQYSIDNKITYGTNRFKLREGPIGFSINSPVYSNADGSNIGIAMGTFDIGYLFQVIMPIMTANKIAVVSFDLSNPGDKLLFATDATITTELMGNASVASAPFVSTVQVQAVDRKWKIVFVPSPTFLNTFSSYEKWIGLFVSIAAAVFVILIAIMIRLQLGATINDMNREKLRILQDGQRKLLNMLDKFARQEAKSRFTVNAIRDYVLIIDNDGKVLQTNDSFDRVFGYGEQELQKGLFASYIFPELEHGFFKQDVANKPAVARKKMDDERFKVIITIRMLPKSEGKTYSEHQVEEEEGYVIIISPADMAESAPVAKQE